MSKAHIYNLGNPVRRQCACRDDGVWFIRTLRTDGPGYTRWKIAPFTHRPDAAWFNGQYARLPENGNDTDHSGDDQ